MKASREKIPGLIGLRIKILENQVDRFVKLLSTMADSHEKLALVVNDMLARESQIAKQARQSD